MKYLLTQALRLLRSFSARTDPLREPERQAQQMAERPETRHEDDADRGPTSHWLDCWVSGSAIR